MSFPTLKGVELELTDLFGPAATDHNTPSRAAWRRRSAGLPGIEVRLEEWPGHLLLIRADPLRPGEESPRVTGWAIQREQPGGPVEVFALHGWVTSWEALALACEYLTRLQRLQAQQKRR